MYSDRIRGGERESARLQRSGQMSAACVFQPRVLTPSARGFSIHIVAKVAEIRTFRGETALSFYNAGPGRATGIRNTAMKGGDVQTVGGGDREGNQKEAGVNRLSRDVGAAFCCAKPLISAWNVTKRRSSAGKRGGERSSVGERPGQNTGRAGGSRFSRNVEAAFCCAKNANIRAKCSENIQRR